MRNEAAPAAKQASPEAPPDGDKARFTSEEWSTLRDAPLLLSMAVASAGASGVLGTLKEAFSSSASLVEAMKSELAAAARDLREGGAAGRAAGPAREPSASSRTAATSPRCATSSPRSRSSACATRRMILARKGDPGDAQAYADVPEGPREARRRGGEGRRLPRLRRRARERGRARSPREARRRAGEQGLTPRRPPHDKEDHEWESMNFLKDAGEKLFGATEAKAAAAPEDRQQLEQKASDAIQSYISKLGLPTTGLTVAFDGATGTCSVSGTCPDQATKEKILLAAGNVAGVAAVDDKIDVPSSEPPAQFREVKKGDTLSKISQGVLRRREQVSDDLRGQQADAFAPGQDLPGADAAHSAASVGDALAPGRCSARGRSLSVELRVDAPPGRARESGPARTVSEEGRVARWAHSWLWLAPLVAACGQETPQSTAQPEPTAVAAARPRPRAFRRRRPASSSQPPSSTSSSRAIALYPDPLLALVLPASTNAIQIVQAQRFLEANTGKEPPSTWDPAIISLLNYPEVVQMLNDDLDWTQALGDAVSAQQADVMDAVQQVRAQAQAAGNLETTKEQKVVVEKEVVKIVPADPEVIYVPHYDPQSSTRRSRRRSSPTTRRGPATGARPRRSGAGMFVGAALTAPFWGVRLAPPRHRLGHPRRPQRLRLRHRPRHQRQQQLQQQLQQQERRQQGQRQLLEAEQQAREPSRRRGSNANRPNRPDGGWNNPNRPGRRARRRPSTQPTRPGQGDRGRAEAGRQRTVRARSRRAPARVPAASRAAARIGPAASPAGRRRSPRTGRRAEASVRRRARAGQPAARRTAWAATAAGKTRSSRASAAPRAARSRPRAARTSARRAAARSSARRVAVSYQRSSRRRKRRKSMSNYNSGSRSSAHSSRGSYSRGGGGGGGGGGCGGRGGGGGGGGRRR